MNTKTKKMLTDKLFEIGRDIRISAPTALLAREIGISVGGTDKMLRVAARDHLVDGEVVPRCRAEVIDESISTFGAGIPFREDVVRCEFPMQSHLQRVLAEVYGIEINVVLTLNGYGYTRNAYRYELVSYSPDYVSGVSKIHTDTTPFDSYSRAMETALYTALEILQKSPVILPNHFYLGQRVKINSLANTKKLQTGWDYIIGDEFIIGSFIYDTKKGLYAARANNGERRWRYVVDFRDLKPL